MAEQVVLVPLTPAAIQDPEAPEQGALTADPPDALTEQADEAAWDRQFAQSHDLLSALGDKAIAEFQAGRTKKIRA